MTDKEFQAFLENNYSDPSFTKWNRWMKRYIEPAYELSRHNEMIKNFNYTSSENHDFVSQSTVYSQLKDDKRLDDEVRKFIGFLAGTGFFKTHQISLIEWFNMKNWVNPLSEMQNRKSINELLEYDKGLVCFKLDLLEMPFWKR